MSTRITAVMEMVKKTSKKKLGALLVSSASNIYYLTSFGDPLSQERDAWMLITGKNAHFFTDGRYESTELSAHMSSQGILLHIISHEKKLTDHLLEICSQEDLKQIEFEPQNLTVAEYERFKSKSIPLSLSRSKTLTSSEPSGLKTSLEEGLQIARSIKDSSEIERIKHACQLVDTLLARVISQIEVGMSEEEILELFYDPTIERAFPPIVAIDENSAIPHYDPKAGKEKRVQKGSLILIDCGVRYKNYCSDITRMVSVGTPSSQIKTAYSSLFKAQQQAIANLSVYKTYKEVDEQCRGMLQNYPLYSHATGHGIGIEVHESPHFSPVSPDTIKSGHVVTVEPGIYIPNKWGMRLEDTVVINPDQSVTTLTTSSQELVII